MREELDFYERQRLSIWWSILLMLPIVGVLIFGCIMQLGMGKPWGNNPMPDAALIIVTAVVSLITPALFFTRIDTVINKEGVWMRAFPSFRGFKLTPWDNISEYVVRKKKLIGDKRGIGVRLVSRRVGTGVRMVKQATYNLSGKYILELKLISKKELIIGTQRPEELTAFLEKLDAERKQK